MRFGCRDLQSKGQRVVLSTLLALCCLTPALSRADLPGSLRDNAGMPSAQVAPELKDVGLEEKMGHTLDLGLKFQDENGQTVTLGDYIKANETPVLISPVYYSCPGLCNFHLNGLVDGLKGLDWTIGKQFKVLAISFDPKETSNLALKKKETYMKAYGRPEAASGWHFLTGDADAIQKFTSAIGFKYKWNEQEKEWAHTSTAVVVSPTGKITRYLPGIMFDPKDIKLALTEASEGKIGTFVDQLVLFCFQYNAHKSKYTPAAFNIMKLAGGLTVVLLGLWLLPIWIRSRRAHAKTGEELKVHDVV